MTTVMKMSSEAKHVSLDYMQKGHSALSTQAFKWCLYSLTTPIFPFSYHALKSMLLQVMLCLSTIQSIKSCCGFDEALWHVLLKSTTWAWVFSLPSDAGV